VQDSVRATPLGERALKGFSAPVTVYRIDGLQAYARGRATAAVSGAHA
jgi:class 3 adenylate cyclase